MLTKIRLKRTKQTDDRLSTGSELGSRFQLFSWDYIIVGDGSATTWEKTAGFGSILYDRRKKTRRKFFGGFSCGTNNVAEIMAVLHPLLWLEARVKTCVASPVVWILSDSDYVVSCGSSETLKKKNHALWTAVHDLSERFILRFRHVPRMILPANCYGDTVGNLVRKTLEELETS
jgi:ribonuclease HI